MRSTLRPSSHRLVLGMVAAAVGVVATAAPAFACGGLVGENGTIQLSKTTTLVAYHDGVEHYVTSFEFTGTGDAVGSIVPLPGIPTKVERGGSWTLQRLEREVNPPPPEEFNDVGLAIGAADSAVVISQTEVDALTLTVLKGGGAAVGKWALDNGFLLTPDAPEMLDYYAQRSQIFMAAKFDANKARQLGQNSGDGTPIQLTIPTSRPWVPLRILSLGLQKATPVDADVFLLTDQRPELLAGGSGLDLSRSGPASAPLLDDLRSDKGTTWVPNGAWLSYLQLHTPASQLKYDLAISTNPAIPPSTIDAGLPLTGASPVVVHRSLPRHPSNWGWVVLLIASGVGCVMLFSAGAYRDNRVTT